tara:strand:+ start:724 stop:879 length:156 start_codon:yes stop_codon:yes gene_type:complete
MVVDNFLFISQHILPYFRNLVAADNNNSNDKYVLRSFVAKVIAKFNLANVF